MARINWNPVAIPNLGGVPALPAGQSGNKIADVFGLLAQTVQGYDKMLDDRASKNLMAELSKYSDPVQARQAMSEGLAGANMRRLGADDYERAGRTINTLAQERAQNYTYDRNVANNAAKDALAQAQLEHGYKNVDAWNAAMRDSGIGSLGAILGEIAGGTRDQQTWQHQDRTFGLQQQRFKADQAHRAQSRADQQARYARQDAMDRANAIVKANQLAETNVPAAREYLNHLGIQSDSLNRVNEALEAFTQGTSPTPNVAPGPLSQEDEAHAELIELYGGTPPPQQERQLPPIGSLQNVTGAAVYNNLKYKPDALLEAAQRLPLGEQSKLIKAAQDDGVDLSPFVDKSTGSILAPSAFHPMSQEAIEGTINNDISRLGVSNTFDNIVNASGHMARVAEVEDLRGKPGSAVKASVAKATGTKPEKANKLFEDVESILKRRGVKDVDVSMVGAIAMEGGNAKEIAKAYEGAMSFYNANQHTIAHIKSLDTENKKLLKDREELIEVATQAQQGAALGDPYALRILEAAARKVGDIDTQLNLLDQAFAEYRKNSYVPANVPSTAVSRPIKDQGFRSSINQTDDYLKYLK